MLTVGNKGLTEGRKCPYCTEGKVTMVQGDKAVLVTCTKCGGTGKSKATQNK